MSIVSAPSRVDVGESVELSVRLYNVSGSGDKGGVSVSFPDLTDSSSSSSRHISGLAEVRASGMSHIDFYEVGDDIYHRGESYPRAARHLLVEGYEDSWSGSSDRRLRVRLTPRVAGRFEILVRGWICADGWTDCERKGGSSTDQQRYSARSMIIEVDEVAAPSDDHGDTRSDATRVSVNASHAGEIETDGDEDWFSFHAREDHRYVIETELGTLDDSELRLYDGWRSNLAHDDDGGPSRASKIEWTATTSGTYYVKVSGDWSSDTGTYRLRVSEDTPPPVEGGDSAHTEDQSSQAGSCIDARNVALNASYTGEIETGGDDEWYAFDALKGYRYVIETSLGTLKDSVLELYRADTRLDSNDDGGDGLASRLEWTADSTGRHCFRIFGYNRNQTGTYEISVSWIDPSSLSDQELWNQYLESLNVTNSSVSDLLELEILRRLFNNPKLALLGDTEVLLDERQVVTRTDELFDVKRMLLDLTDPEKKDPFHYHFNNPDENKRALWVVKSGDPNIGRNFENPFKYEVEIRNLDPSNVEKLVDEDLAVRLSKKLTEIDDEFSRRFGDSAEMRGEVKQRIISGAEYEVWQDIRKHSVQLRTSYLIEYGGRSVSLPDLHTPDRFKGSRVNFGQTRGAIQTLLEHHDLVLPKNSVLEMIDDVSKSQSRAHDLFRFLAHKELVERLVKEGKIGRGYELKHLRYVVKIGGRTLVVFGIGVDAYEIWTAEDKVREGVVKASAWATGTAFAVVWFKVASPISTTGVGTIIYIGGGMLSGAAGYFFGEYVGGAVYDSATNHYEYESVDGDLIELVINPDPIITYN